MRREFGSKQVFDTIASNPCRSGPRRGWSLARRCLARAWVPGAPPSRNPGRVTAAATLSVVVPLAPGEAEWQELLAQLGAELPTGSEVLLVATGERPAPPPAWPERIALRRLCAGAGRAPQMNAGARQATGNWLWFLHTDSRLEPATVRALLAFVGRGDDALGWFDLAFRPGGPALMPLNAWGANLRSAWLGMPFGDQGFAIPARLFSALGGFDEDAPYGEDHLLAWAARRSGIPLCRIGARLLTSARKYERAGWAATTFRHLRLTTVQAWPEWRRLRGAAR